ncbi:MAG: hypothetical protein VX834_09620 [Myxococcota bacterium]|nr:hypothetical protein [Myxococcota bacterium]
MHDLSVSSSAFTLRLCLVLAMAFALGACGDNAEPAAKTPSAADASSTACAPDTGTVSPDADSASGSSPSSPTDTDPADSATTPCAEDPNAPTDSDSTPEPDSGSPSDNSAESSDDGPASPSCDRSGFTPAVHQASYAQGAFRYQASTSEAAPFDAVFIDSFFEQYGGPSTPGSYSLEGFNYADCGLCLLATLGCTSQGCDTYFYADAGALDITAFGQDGQAFTGVMRDVIFREVTIDPQTYQSTPVPGGQVWCMDGYTFDVTVGAGNVPVSADTPIGDDSSGSTNGGPTTDTTDSGESDGGSGSSSDNGTSPTPSGDGVDALGNQNHTLDSVTMTVVASQFEGLNAPTDLEFNPLRSGELWVVNQGDDTTTVLFSPEADETWLCNAGYYNTNDGCDCGCGIPDPDCPSSSVDACEYGCGPGQQPNPNNPSQCIITGASGTPSEAFPRFIKRVPGDSTNSHFLAKPSALAFGENGAFASIHEEDEITQFDTPWDFMGPTLWTTEFALFDSGHLSHIDMLHNTPNGVGIAWEVDNVYWVYDGHHGSLTRYNFNQDHGPAGTDHSDGVVYRYV